MPPTCMVKTNIILSTIRAQFLRKFGDSIIYLVACGSLGRDDLKDKWSDIDLLLVLDKIDLESLKEIATLENQLKNKLKREVDIAVLSKLEFYKADIKSLPDKFRNYIFFIEQEKIIIGKESQFRKMSADQYLENSKVYILDYHRRLRKIITDKIHDRDNSKKLLAKIIKFLILLLRKTVADKKLQPNSFHEAIEYAEIKNIPLQYQQVKMLEKIRGDDILDQLSDKQVRDYTKQAYGAVIDLTNYYIKSL